MQARLSFSVLAMIVMAGCVSQDPVTRMSISPASATTQQVSQQETLLLSQAQALEQMSRDVVRKSTINGAVVGAVAGCGLTLLNAANAQSCVGGLLVGGAVGTVVGKARGERELKRRKQLVSPSALVRSLGKADDQMDRISMDLRSTLDKQDAELAALSKELETGRIQKADYTARRDAIRDARTEVAQALTLTATQARTAYENLQHAKAEGQSGLEWHLNATRKLEREATSARSAISLL